MATEVKPNYSPAQEAIIREVAAANGGVITFALCEEIAARDDMRDNDGNLRKARSISAKVSRMDDVAYQPKERASKDGSPIAKKDDIVADIAAALDVATDKLASLDKAGKPTLRTLLDAVKAAKAA